MRLCFATNNAHKIEEVQALLGKQFNVVSLKDVGCSEELAEDQETIEGNSLQKAQYVFDNYQVDCFADDTGLEVEALNGEPGVYSARYAGPQRMAEDNMNLLLANLSGKANRKARFRTVVTLITKQGTHQFEGVLPGTIIKERRGTQGFGYDPVFLPENSSRTLAEMNLEAKNTLSHRARAIEKLVVFLNEHHLA